MSSERINRSERNTHPTARWGCLMLCLRQLDTVELLLMPTIVSMLKVLYAR